MINFQIGTQIENELKEFRTKKVRLASVTQNDPLVRYAVQEPEGYYFNQEETLNIIDLYYNSKFEKGVRDSNKLRKMFMNTGKFRSEVSSKQIEIDSKHGKFIPDDYADPWTAIFLQKEFNEWSKETYFGELLNECVEKFPKYGTVVLKKVGKEIRMVQLQNLRNEQTAESLKVARYVIEEHPDMSKWEIDQMKNWNKEGLMMKYDQTMTVYERYGYVPLKWLKEANDEEAKEGDEMKFVDTLVVCGKNPGSNPKNYAWHIFFAGQITERPYREAHWNKQYGRWLGLGVMEDLIENQKAKNIIVNLMRKRMQWSSKVIAQARNSNMTVKNLMTEVPDGGIVEVGNEGEISVLDFANRNTAEFQQFLNQWEQNADQKAFTYEVATGESLPSGTPFRLGVVLSRALNTYFEAKRERLGLFLEKVVQDFLVPQFMRDMQNEEKVISMFSDEPGYEVLKEAAMNFVRSEAVRASLLSGRPVDAGAIEEAVEPFLEIKSLFFKREASYYKELKFKYTFTFTGESIDLEAKMETLKSLFTLLIQQGDAERAEKVLIRIAALGGEAMAQFGSRKNVTAPANLLPAKTAAPNGQRSLEAV